MIQFGADQTYNQPVHLPGFGTAMVDLKEIATMGNPDAAGSVLPPSVTEGKLVIEAATGNEADAINILYWSGGIYNPTKATCGETCETCNGCTNFLVSPTRLMTAFRSSDKYMHSAHGTPEQ